jgi:glycosyl transferase family 87
MHARPSRWSGPHDRRVSFGRHGTLATNDLSRSALAPAAVNAAPNAPPARRPSIALVVSASAAGLGLILLLGALPTLSTGIGFGFDFDAYYAAAGRLIAGERLYLAETVIGPFTHGTHGLYVYAPPLALGLLPLAGLDLATATVAWYLLRILILAIACALLPVRPWVRFAAFAVTAFSAPFLSDQSLGNVNALLLLLLAIAWRWLDRPVSAIAVAATIAIRPQMVILLAWWAIRRRWSLVAWCLGAGLVLVILTLPIVGIAAYVDFIQVLRNIRFEGAANNVAVPAIAADLGLPAPIGTVGYVTGAAIGLVAVVASRRRAPAMGFVVGVAATLLLTPLLWPHYLVLVVLPAAFMADRGWWWAIGLPLLGWLPSAFLPLVGLAGVLGPYLAPRTDRPSDASVRVEGARAGEPGDLQAYPVADLRP